MSASDAELQAILAAHPDLPSLLRPGMDEPERVEAKLLCSGPAPYFVIQVPIPRRRGRIWVSRLPGAHPATTERNLEALERFGIRRVVCLVPAAVMSELHGATRYLELARSRFDDRFHLVEVPDHGVPLDDAVFERAVEDVDLALAAGEEVLVHCVGGCGRTGMLTACVLIRAGLHWPDAIAHFRRYRRCGPETPAQLAYVVRFCRRSAVRTGTSSRVLRVTLSRNPAGDPIRLARGGLAELVLGRAHLTDGTHKRVAIKRFAAPIGARRARELETTIERLRAAGVRLPKMFMWELNAGVWAQVAQLFGATARGSKLIQPGDFHTRLSLDAQRFVADQLTRVVNAGYHPSLDLFLVFRSDPQRLLPADLDLIAPVVDVLRRAQELVKRLTALGTSRGSREQLRAVANAAATAEVRAAVDAVLDDHGGAHRRLWDWLNG